MALNTSDFFAQFQPYEQGGITGQPSVDPSQLQQQPRDSLPTKPGAPIYQPGPSSADLAAQHPDWPKTPWGMPYDPSVGYNTGINGGNRGGAPEAVPGIMKEPGNAWGGMDWMNPVDPSRYDPGKSYDDYARDYWAPDREQVLRQHPQAPVYHLMGGTLGNLGSPGNSAFGQAGGNGINGSTWGKVGSMGNLANLGTNALGGMFGIGGGQGGGMGVFQALANKFQQMRTPSGRILSVPQEHVQEALRRGALHL